MFRAAMISVAVAVMAIFAIGCTGDMPSSPVSSGEPAGSVSAEKYIIVMNGETGSGVQAAANVRSEVSALMGAHGIADKALVAVYDAVFKGFCAELTPAQLGALRNDKAVKYIEKDQIVKLNDPVSSEVENPRDAKQLAQWTPTNITRVGGPVNATASTGIAWIVDTGICLDHPDLNVNKTLSKTFVTSYPDNLSGNDYHGHGSHVAGIVAAKNNTIGVVGVSAGAELVAVKVMDRTGSGTISQIINGLNYIKTKLNNGRVNVINMSLTSGASSALDDAVRSVAAAGAYVVVAAGNYTKDVSSYSPARVNADRVCTVSACDSYNKFASFSNFGYGVDFSAPGVGIYSTSCSNGYRTLSGTSMAAPHVAGIILATGGSVSSRGLVISDPDQWIDKLASR